MDARIAPPRIVGASGTAANHRRAGRAGPGARGGRRAVSGRGRAGDGEACRGGAPRSLAEKRFRPEYRAAFDAWMTTRPFTNPHAPPGPQSMPQYKPEGEAEFRALDANADALTGEGEHDGETGDDYVRTTVILASVLFLVGISSHFAVRPVRIGLLVFASVLLVLAAIAVTRLPVPP